MRQRGKHQDDWPGDGKGPDGPLHPETLVIALILLVTVLGALARLFR